MHHPHDIITLDNVFDFYVYKKGDFSVTDCNVFIFIILLAIYLFMISVIYDLFVEMMLNLSHDPFLSPH